MEERVKVKEKGTEIDREREREQATQIMVCENLKHISWRAAASKMA